MKKILVVLSLVMLTGCSTVMEWMPSRWDVNQAKVITDIQQQTRHFDCKADQVAQLNELAKSIEWFDIYSKTKPTRDISKLNATIISTIQEYQERLKKGPVSPLYCDLKLKLLKQQADILAGSVQGRF